MVPSEVLRKEIVETDCALLSRGCGIKVGALHWLNNLQDCVQVLGFFSSENVSFFSLSLRVPCKSETGMALAQLPKPQF